MGLTDSLIQYAMKVLPLCVWLALLTVVFLPIERAFALRGSRLSWRARLEDIGFYFLNNLLPATVLAFLMSQVVMLGRLVLPAGYFEWAATLPLLVAMPVSLLVAEIGFYWGHRWAHEIPLLWRFHAVHHEPEHLHFMANTRGHPIDMIFVRLCGLTPLYLLGLARFAEPRGDAIAATVVIVGMFWGFLIHANVHWRLGPLEQLVASPFFHHWHHTRDGAINRNYAATLPVMDRLFGTYHMPANWPERYGILPENIELPVETAAEAVATLRSA